MAPAPILAFASLDSTNAEARRRAEAGEAGPLWITAEVQTAGRGRRGRGWSTEAGNLAATLLFSTTRTAAEAAQLSFVTALAVSDLARAFVEPQMVSLKWPNDVMVNGLKVSGILLESGRHEGTLWVAAGMGVNLASAPEGTERPAAALGDFMGRPAPTPSEAMGVLAEAFDRRLAAWEAGGFVAVRDAWLERAQGMGERCIARLEHETIEGVAEGLEPNGALRLRLADGGVRLISAGDVFFQGAA
jgi:BirA family transcriptional regulator, biotin operon repressor / biotin---[acetyl-CoA-carboxylase] ligase